MLGFSRDPIFNFCAPVIQMDDAVASLRLRINQARGSGRVLFGSSSIPEATIQEIAHEFGLDPNPAKYRACSLREARIISKRVISHHLVHDGPLASEIESESLSAEFLALFPPVGTSFFTNGEFALVFDRWYLSDWRQVTPERSSSGLIVLAPDRSGVLWVADIGPGEGAAKPDAAYDAEDGHRHRPNDP